MLFSGLVALAGASQARSADRIEVTESRVTATAWEGSPALGNDGEEPNQSH